MNRRAFLSTVAPGVAVVALAGCASGSQGAVTLEAAKVWVPGFAGAIVAAAASYTGPQAAQVAAIAAQLKDAANAFAAMGDVSTARSAVLSIIALAQQLMPMVSAFIPPQVAPFVPMALAVLSAFVSALPPPPDAPAVPPAALVSQRAALKR